MSFLHDLYFFRGQKYTSFGKNILLRQSTSLGLSSTGHPGSMLKCLKYTIVVKSRLEIYTTLKTFIAE